MVTIPNRLSSKTCLGGCPSDKTPLGLDHSGGSCSRGARARCCDTGYKTIEKRYNDEDDEFDYYLDLFLTEGAMCVDSSSGDDAGRVYFAQEFLEVKIYQILYGTAAESTTDVWAERIGLRYKHLGLGNIRSWALSNSAALRLGSGRLPRRLICGLTTFNNLIGGENDLKCTCSGVQCCISQLCKREDSLQRRDDNGTVHAIEGAQHANGNISSLLWDESDGIAVLLASDDRKYTINVFSPELLRVVNFVITALIVNTCCRVLSPSPSFDGFLTILCISGSSHRRSAYQ